MCRKAIGIVQKLKNHASVMAGEFFNMFQIAEKIESELVEACNFPAFISNHKRYKWCDKLFLWIS
ncbi:hypothetical protein D9603_15695 [Pseudoalteromonas sp. PS5]|nr:hypothetical protein D9603_15695 [Pseudoalteromonas sp. PS5]